MEKQKFINGLPLYYLETDETDEDSGLKAISFVEDAATEMEWFTFSKEKEFKFETDNSKRVITCPVMLAETPIYRDMGGKEFYIAYSEDEVFKMMKKYFKDNKIHNVNENHNENNMIEDVTMIECFFVGDRVESKLYPDIPKGSCIASFYIQDEKYWNDVILGGDFTGFSLEGKFGLVEATLSKTSNIIPQKKEDNLEDELYSEIEKLLKEDKTPSQIYDELKEKLSDSDKKI